MIAYLDWSNFCDAFRVADEPAKVSEGHRALRRTIDSLSRHRCLAFSPSHVAELLLWHPKERALRMARWLDTLNLTWVRALNPECDEELHSWLDTVDPSQIARPYRPFAGLLLTAYAPVSNAAALDGASGGSRTIESIIQEGHADPSGINAHRFGIERFQALHSDRKAALAMSPGDVRKTLDANFRNLLIQKALVPCPLARPRTLAEVSALVDTILSIPPSVPFSRLAHTLICKLAESLTTQDPHSKAFQSRYRATTYDLQHLLGGAYCDVFTCDFRVDEALGTAREALGWSRQLSIRGCGGLQGLVARLRELCGAVAG